LALEKIHHTNSELNLPKITSVMQDHSDGQKITASVQIIVFTELMIPWFSYSPNNTVSAEWLACWTEVQKAWVQIAATTL